MNCHRIKFVQCPKLSPSFPLPSSKDLEGRACRSQHAPRVPLVKPGNWQKLHAVADASSAMESPAARPAFPFVRIAGQDDMKLGLMLNVIDPSIGGFLIMGDRGTGKSIAVRALVDLLPIITVAAGDRFNSDPTDPELMSPDVLSKYENGEEIETAQIKTPLVELPLGATEDRVCGTIDVEQALSKGVRAFEPGLLALANRGILYVDEVNLLDDGLVDLVLDSAASGVNTVEREGISIVHPAKFIMIGSGNPQEGELRPQLLDRFGLSVNVYTLQDREERVKLVLDKMSYDKDPDAYVASCMEDQESLRKKLLAAKELLPNVTMPRDLKLKVSEICSRLNIDGLRGDIVVTRSSCALAALEGRTEVILEDTKKVLALALNHRLRKDPLDPIDSGTKVAKMFKMVTDPKFKEAEAKAQDKAKEKQAPPKKPGAWGGLP